MHGRRVGRYRTDLFCSCEGERRGEREEKRARALLLAASFFRYSFTRSLPNNQPQLRYRSFSFSL